MAAATLPNARIYRSKIATENVSADQSIEPTNLQTQCCQVLKVVTCRIFANMFFCKCTSIVINVLKPNCKMVFVNN